MPNISTVPYFYDKQFRRYIQQFIRLFAGFQIVISYDSEGNPIYQTVPVRYGDISRVAAHIQRQNSENTVSTVPFFSCHVTQLQMSPERRTYPQFEDKVPIYEKKFNEETLTYENEIGNMYTVYRYQPVPYTLTMQADLWTSNTEQKLQLMEQVLVLFNPSLNIHTTNNALDWSSLSVVELKNVTWSNRVIPSGVDDVIDIASLQFELPILINPPAKVLKNTLIHTIIGNIHDVATGSASTINSVDDIVPRYTAYKIVTLENYKLRFTVNDSGIAVAKLLNKQNGTTDTNGNNLTWDLLFESYGEFRPGISQIRLKQTSDPSDTSNDIIGTVERNSLDASELFVTLDIDTVPANTQAPVNAVIDPQYNYPGDGTIPAATSGDRYLLLKSIPEGSAWSGTSADANDIIEFNGSVWSVVFDASNNTESIHYTVNLTTLDKLKWTGSVWINAYEGTYNPGFWRIYL